MIKRMRHSQHFTPDKLVGPFRTPPAEVQAWCHERLREARLEIHELPLTMHRRGDLTGLSYGTSTKRFIVFGYAGRRTGSRARPHLWYVCCECRRIITVSDKTLRAGRLTRCQVCVREDTDGRTYNRRRDERRAYHRKRKEEIERAEIAAEMKRAQRPE